MGVSTFISAANNNHDEHRIGVSADPLCGECEGFMNALENKTIGLC